MKIAFVVYHDVLETKVNSILSELGVDYYTEWEQVKGKGHEADAHLGTRTFPGYNCVKMIAFSDENPLSKFIELIQDVNKHALREDDKVRLFQVPLERMV